jgi:hypothetical protein
MTIHISGRKLLVAALAVVMIAVACFIAFLAGQTTRVTEADADSRARTAVQRAVERTRTEETAKRNADVKSAQTAARKHETRRVKRINRTWRKRLARETEQARQAGIDSGYASGQSVGFVSGKEEGEEEGFEEGVEEGLEEASDDLVCSDDPDVPLPFCSF